MTKKQKAALAVAALEKNIRMLCVRLKKRSLIAC